MIKRILLTVLFLATAAVGQANDWPQWRGPFLNGSSDEKDLPSKWSQTENIAWAAPLPGAAASTPIISGDRVFLSGVDASRDMLVAMAFDRATGKLLWTKDVGTGIRQDSKSNFASDSPATDGKTVVFFYGSGQMLACDFDGKQLWAKNIQEEFGAFTFGWTFSSSPLLYGGKLYLQVLQRDVPVHGRGLTDRENESYLLAFDPATGKTLWRKPRPSDAAEESHEAFTTPIIAEVNKKPQLLVAGGDALTGHNPETGEELWRWAHYNPRRVNTWRLVPSPVAGDGIALLCAPKKEPIYAIRLQRKGKLDGRDMAWKSPNTKEVSSDVPTPAFYSHDFFVLGDAHSPTTVYRVETLTGRVKWATPAPGKAKYEASPLVADNKIYIVNFEGLVSVFHAGTGDLIRSIPMDKPAHAEVVRSSIAAAGGQLFIRTTRKLYCVGKPN